MLPGPGKTQPAKGPAAGPAVVAGRAGASKVMDRGRTMPHAILLIEDEPGIAASVLYALRTEGMEVAWHTTAREGLAVLARGGIDLVVLDVGLPDANGFEVCRRLRETSQVPVLFLTARADEVDRVVGLELGADDYVVKPFSPRELSARVKAVLRRSAGRSAGNASASPPAAPAALAVGPFVLDEERQRITCHGRALELSRCQYRLLGALLRRPGKIFSRGELMDEAWDEPAASFDRVIDSHIKDLRAKLRAAAMDDDPIRTHRGQGYSLREDW
jgi:two-component system catabolic regulation response regulator CreB